MELLLLPLIIAIFILPSFLMMRSQRRRQAEMQSMQAAIGAGDRVVTVAGIHGTITAARDTQVEVEIAPGVEVTMDRIAIMRKATPEDLGVVGGTAAATGATGSTAAGEQVGYQHPEYPETTTERAEHPENAPEFPDHPENNPGDQGHPENR
ncbi:preprotein translocase subunit YajC [Corynebacterium sp.]|uniref:preprotein translocase subunit YajC n=1 Tax=Corynebacterium sp. TaxID=1720 RepID=UPI0026DF1A38|nr:preprotein translocase subunit YajC [Corynebacterium sp.]MDO5511808.1 preprotein translocase subunit YajC [Corynebacterium sp.]